MSTDPTPVGDPAARELAARKAAQAVRAQRAEDGEIDRQIDTEHQCPECGPTSEPARQYGYLSGYVYEPIVHHEYGEPREVVEGRPCFTCNPERWRAWQDGRLRSTSKPKVESATDRQAREQDRARRERSSFA